MQRIVGWTFLILFNWQLVGFLLFFEWNHYHVKKEIKSYIKRGVPEEDLVEFHFSTHQLNQLTWIKSHEFEWQGHLFDVIDKRKEKNGKVLLKCISDTQEKVLFKTLDKSIANHLNGKGTTSPVAKVFKLLSLPLISHIQEISIVCIPEFSVKNYFFSTYREHKVSIEPATPPPNKICF